MECCCRVLFFLLVSMNRGRDFGGIWLVFNVLFLFVVVGKIWLCILFRMCLEYFLICKLNWMCILFLILVVFSWYLMYVLVSMYDFISILLVLVYFLGIMDGLIWIGLGVSYGLR